MLRNGVAYVAFDRKSWVPLTDRVAAAGRTNGTVTFVGGGRSEPEVVPWGVMHADARAMAAALQARGVVAGDHVAILSPTSRDLVVAIQGCWMAGAASMVLPLPMRMGSLDEFINGTRGRIVHGEAKLLLIADDLAPFYERQPGDPPTVNLADVMPRNTGLVAADCVVPEPDPERLVILQYTSGSTSEPKGVMIPDKVLCSNLDAIQIAGNFTQHSDVFVSWLPLYHDMGLVGALGQPMTTGKPLVQAAPQDFMARPGNWMQWISDFGGTATAGPNFSWVLATRALKRMEGIDLSTMRVSLSGAEPVDPDAVDAFVAEAVRHGFRPESVFPAFGMAELAIGGTFPEPMAGLLCDVVDAAVLERDGVAKPVDLPVGHVAGADDGVRRLAILGRAVPGLELRICGTENGETLADRHVGELEIRGSSVTTGYYKDPEATAAMFRDEWLRTGDLGYLIDGQLVLCGRLKDVIIVGGRNVYPHDIERAITNVDGIRPGNVIAFGIGGYKGKESVVVVAESKLTDSGELLALERVIHHRVLEAVGLPPRDVMLIQPGTLPKTSSGKLQRAKCAEMYMNESLALLK